MTWQRADVLPLSAADEVRLKGHSSRSRSGVPVHRGVPSARKSLKLHRKNWRENRMMWQLTLGVIHALNPIRNPSPETALNTKMHSPCACNASSETPDMGALNSYLCYFGGFLILVIV